MKWVNETIFNKISKKFATLLGCGYVTQFISKNRKLGIND